MKKFSDYVSEAVPGMGDVHKLQERPEINARVEVATGIVRDKITMTLQQMSSDIILTISNSNRGSTSYAIQSWDYNEKLDKLEKAFGQAIDKIRKEYDKYAEELKEWRKKSRMDE